MSCRAVWMWLEGLGGTWDGLLWVGGLRCAESGCYGWVVRQNRFLQNVIFRKWLFFAHLYGGGVVTALTWTNIPHLATVGGSVVWGGYGPLARSVFVL